MSSLQHRQQLMQDKRKQTPWKDFVREIVSLRSFNLYQRDGMTTVFPPTERVPSIISHQAFEQQRGGLLQQGLDYDPGQEFFCQFEKLWQQTNLPPTILFGACDNANYTDQTVGCRNSYLSYVVINECENVLYSVSVKEGSRNVFNSLMVRDSCDNVYCGTGVIRSFNIFYSRFVKNCSDLRFCSNMVGCRECIRCHDLDNASYCIDNQQYSKEEYLTRKAQFLAHKDQFAERYEQVDRKSKNHNSSNINGGSGNIECQDVEQGFLNYQLAGGRNAILIGGKGAGEHVYDSFLQTPTEEHIYGVFSTGFGSHIYNSHQIRGGSNIYYSYLMDQCSHCLGCIGLQNASYCILNKQYSKDEWHQQVDIIFQHMQDAGTLGEFFPARLNPFYFNDTAAVLLGDFTREEVIAAGYLWRDEEVTVDVKQQQDSISIDELAEYEHFCHPGTEGNEGHPGSLQTEKRSPSSGEGQDLGGRSIDPGILKKVIRDPDGNRYRILKIEYDFLIKYGLPLPRKHRLQRIKELFCFV